jgi:hypothetical protein
MESRGIDLLFSKEPTPNFVYGNNRWLLQLTFEKQKDIFSEKLRVSNKRRGGI